MMNPGGNWTTDGSLMATSLYSDLRSTGNWVPSESDVVNSTGKVDELKKIEE